MTNSMQMAEYERQFDPTVVALPDGRFRLYFTSIAVSHSFVRSAAFFHGL
jgi:hypothetical protein